MLRHRSVIGKLTTNFTIGIDYVGLAVDPDGKFVLAGRAGTKIGVARYLSA